VTKFISLDAVMKPTIIFDEGTYQLMYENYKL